MSGAEDDVVRALRSDHVRRRAGSLSRARSRPVRKDPEQTRVYRRQLYLDRKLSGVCIDCRAGLTDDDGLRCVECTHKALVAKQRWRAKQPLGRMRKEDRTRRQSRHTQRAEQGLCVNCLAPRWNGTTMCLGHLSAARRFKREWLRRKRAGLIPLRPKRARKPIPRVQTERIVDRDRRLDERFEMLRALRRLEWPSTTEWFDALETSEDVRDPKRVSRYQLVGRLVKHGFAERRGPSRNQYEYQITPAGRAELKRLEDMRIAACAIPTTTGAAA